MISPATVRDLRATVAIRLRTGAQILTGDSGWTRARFAAWASRGDGPPTPVIIPARDEQHDLPATLLALARSRCPVIPIVVDNGSGDDTAAVAHQMGAHVLPAPTGAKMAATQAGLTYATQRWPGTPLLFTDADTLVLPTWAQTMRRHLPAGTSAGAAVFGTVWCWHGRRRYVDVVLSAVKLGRSLARAAAGRAPVGRGANYGLRPDQDGRMAAALMALDPNLFEGDDTAIRDTLHHTGALLRLCLDLRAGVVTRNDRYPTLTARYGPRRNAYQRS